MPPDLFCYLSETISLPFSCVEKDRLQLLLRTPDEPKQTHGAAKECQASFLTVDYVRKTFTTVVFFVHHETGVEVLTP